MKGRFQNAMRLLTRTMRPFALRSAGKEGSGTAVIRHVGRRTGRAYQTPVVAAAHDDAYLIALPYGERTDWLRNVLANGSATLVSGGQEYQVDNPELIPMSDATGFFRPQERRLHRRFGVETALPCTACDATAARTERFRCEPLFCALLRRTARPSP